MQTSIEIPITIVNTGTGYVQIAPSPGFDRLPASRPLHPDLGFERELVNWERNPANQAARDNLQERLEEVGRSVYTLLPGESLQSILNLGGLRDNPNVWWRVLVYTDSISSQIPVEVLWSDEYVGGQPMGFVDASDVIPLSIVRHLGLEPTAPMAIERRKPLRMLVVYSNPKETGWRLGEVTVKNDCLDFQEQSSLWGEKQALDGQLKDLVRLGLLEIHFLVGDGRSQDGSAVYQGRFRYQAGQTSWKVEQKHGCHLRDILLRFLGSKTWHILHYFGHGAGGSGGPELALRPGNNLLLTDITIRRMPRIVILNACESANPADPAAPVLTGFATFFLLHGTVNLVCMQRNVTPKTATLTTQALYYRLARSLFTRQMDFEEALHKVRQQVHNQADPRLDFFCPVLYSRPVDGPTFDYQDNRLRTWRSIRRQEQLPWNPVKLCKVVSWCLKTKGQT